MATNNTKATTSTKKEETKQKSPSPPSNGEINFSKYKTNPPLQVFGDTSNKVRPNTYKQLGRATSFVSNGDSLYVNTGPHQYALATWDYARKNEPIISDGLDKIVLSVLAKIGSYNHPNPDIRKFIKANLKHKIRHWIENITYSMLWSGKSVSEIIWEKKWDGDTPQLWVKDLINYHTSQVILRLNNYGTLTHGEQVLNSQFNTGVWVPRPILTEDKKMYKVDRNNTGSHIRLAKDKLIIATYKDEGNNPHGTPALYAAIQWSLYKAAFVDMYSIALDRYGTPLMYFIVPATQTTEDMEEVDGTIRKKMFREALQDELQDLRSGSVLILERQGNKDAAEPKVESLTTGNNFGDSFITAIDKCDQNMLHAMGIPNLLIKNQDLGLGSGGTTEKQVEMFEMSIEQIAIKVSEVLIDQLIKTLITYNFSPKLVDHADNYGEFIIKPIRYVDYKVMAESAKILTEAGVIAPLVSEMDRKFIRNQLGIPNDHEDA
jgi:hypothetical protein